MVKRVALVSVVAVIVGGSSVQEANLQTYKETAKPTPTATIEVDGKALANYEQMQSGLKYLKTRVNRTAYVYSGNTPEGWDCSGMVTWLYERFGLTLPHSADDLGHIGERVSKPVAGDIVVMAYDGRTDFYHTGIYLGDNKVINANRFYQTTVIESLDEYKNNQIRFVRVVEQQDPDTLFVTKPTENCWSKYKTENAAIENCEER